jgi:hypothetical protein
LFEQFFASDSLAVILVPNLEPLRVLWQVGIAFALRHDSFEIVFASEPEQM